MPHTLAIHKVADYDKWKVAFGGKESVAFCQAAGEKSYMILRTIDEPNTFALLNEWEDMDRLRMFMQSGKLQKLQSASGVVGQPEVYVFGEVEEGSV